VTLGLHVILRVGVEDLGIADIGAIEEAKEVDACRERDDPQVLLPDEGLLLGRLDHAGDAAGERRLRRLLDDHVGKDAFSQLASNLTFTADSTSS